MKSRFSHELALRRSHMYKRRGSPNWKLRVRLLILFGSAVLTWSSASAAEYTEYGFTEGAILPYLFHLRMEHEGIDRCLHGAVVVTVSEVREHDVVLHIAENIRPRFDIDNVDLKSLLKQPSTNRFINEKVVLPKTGFTSRGNEERLPFMLGPLERWLFPPLHGVLTRSEPYEWKVDPNTRIASTVPAGDGRSPLTRTMLHRWDFSRGTSEENPFFLTHTRRIRPAVPTVSDKYLRLTGEGTASFTADSTLLKSHVFSATAHEHKRETVMTSIDVRIQPIRTAHIAKALRKPPPPKPIVVAKTPAKISKPLARPQGSVDDQLLNSRPKIKGILQTRSRIHILHKLNSQDEKVVRQGIAEIRKMRPNGEDQRVAAALEKLVGTEHTAAALWELHRWATTDSIPSLVKCFDTSKEHRESAALALGRLGTDVEPFILPLLSTRDRKKQKFVIDILSKVGSGRSVGALDSLARSDDHSNARYAKRALAIVKARAAGKM